MFYRAKDNHDFITKIFKQMKLDYFEIFVYF